VDEASIPPKTCSAYLPLSFGGVAPDCASCTVSAAVVAEVTAVVAPVRVLTDVLVPPIRFVVPAALPMLLDVPEFAPMSELPDTCNVLLPMMGPFAVVVPPTVTLFVKLVFPFTVTELPVRVVLPPLLPALKLPDVVANETLPCVCVTVPASCVEPPPVLPIVVVFDPEVLMFVVPRMVFVTVPVMLPIVVLAEEPATASPMVFVFVAPGLIALPMPVFVVPVELPWPITLVTVFVPALIPSWLITGPVPVALPIPLVTVPAPALLPMEFCVLPAIELSPMLLIVVPPPLPKVFVVPAPVPIVELPDEVSVVNAPVFAVVEPIVPGTSHVAPSRLDELIVPPV